MTQVIHVERDPVGLRAAAFEMFVETMTKVERERPARSLADGYYYQVEYLLWLKSRQRVAKLDLSAQDVEGICAVDSAHDEFTDKYPQCGSCGQRVGKFLMSMHKCRRKN